MSAGLQCLPALMLVSKNVCRRCNNFVSRMCAAVVMYVSLFVMYVSLFAKYAPKCMFTCHTPTVTPHAWLWMHVSRVFFPWMSAVMHCQILKCVPCMSAAWSTRASSYVNHNLVEHNLHGECMSAVNACQPWCCHVGLGSKTMYVSGECMSAMMLPCLPRIQKLWTNQ